MCQMHSVGECDTNILVEYMEDIVRDKYVSWIKPETEKVLLDELSRHEYVADGGEYDVAHLFGIFSTFEIKKKSDLCGAQKKFRHFVNINIGMFKASTPEEVERINHSARFCTENITAYSYSGRYRRALENYLKVIKAVVPEKKDSMLDVGSGTIPFLAILLSEEGYNVTAMDQFVLSNECLRNLGVKSLREFFTSRTRVGDYDIVTGRRPCTAIPHIVSRCSSEKKPYMVKLCTCNSPNNKISGWRNLLRDIDPDIQYVGDYIYNFKFGDGKYDIGSTEDKIVNNDETYEEELRADNGCYPFDPEMYDEL